MINNDVNAGNFIYCITHWGPYESKSIRNAGNGLYHQYTYLIDGNLEIEFRNTPDGEVVHRVDSKTYNGKLLDHSTLPKYETVSTGSEGTTAMFFNPIAETRLLDIDILTEGTHQIGVNTKRLTIVCIQHEIIANGNKLIAMQHAIVFPGKTAELVIPEHGICAIVSYSDDLDNLLSFDSRY
jgi:hypothetical protein